MKISVKSLEPNNAQLTCYILDSSPEMPNAALRPAILIFPGGGFYMCADREAEPVALAYTAEGYNAFVLRYTVGPSTTPSQATEDAAAAIRYLRNNAEEFAIDTSKIAVVGFSAGGYVAASLGTIGNDKPAALILGYPVILGELGKTLGKELQSLDSLVNETTPPTFLFSTQGDSIVPISHSLSFASALATHGVPFETHIFLVGEHGLSLAKNNISDHRATSTNADVAQWLPMSARFLDNLWGGFVPQGTPYRDFKAATKRFGLDMPLATLFQNVECAALLEKYVPGIKEIILSSPMIKNLSLRKLSAVSPDQFPAELVQKIEPQLNVFNTN